MISESPFLLYNKMDRVATPLYEKKYNILKKVLPSQEIPCILINAVA